ncbi:hypothetical protein BDF19DRAFT_270149 [Syncephalis fuscata]|nr:hypothetical protein BDF19DRAFT_270149 [Syncephalis fuscata]
MMEFEALISTTETKKMSLTPARMRTIESNDHKKLQPRDPARALKKLFSSATNSVSNASNKSRPLSINLRRKGTSKSQPTSPTKPDIEVPPMPTDADTFHSFNNISQHQTTSMPSLAQPASVSDKPRQRSKRALKHVGRMEALGEDIHEEATDDDSLPATSRSQSPASIATNSTPRTTASRPALPPQLSVTAESSEAVAQHGEPVLSPGRYSLSVAAPRPWVEVQRPVSTDTSTYNNNINHGYTHQQQQYVSGSVSMTALETSLHTPSKSQPSLPSPRSSRITRRTLSEERHQANKPQDVPTMEVRYESPRSTPPSSRSFADLEREHRAKMELSMSRSSSRDSSNRRNLTITDDNSVLVPPTRCASSSTLEKGTTMRATPKPITPAKLPLIESSAASTLPSETRRPLVKSLSYNSTMNTHTQAGDRTSICSINSFVTANESDYEGRSRCTSDAADMNTNQHTVMPRSRNITINTRKESTAPLNAISALVTPPGNDMPIQMHVEKHNMTRSTEYNVSVIPSMQFDNTLEHALSSPSPSSIISVSEITYSVDSPTIPPTTMIATTTTTTTMVPSPLFSPLNHVDTQQPPQVVAREKAELRRAYSFGSLSHHALIVTLCKLIYRSGNHQIFNRLHDHRLLRLPMKHRPFPMSPHRLLARHHHNYHRYLTTLPRSLVATHYHR